MEMAKKVSNNNVRVDGMSRACLATWTSLIENVLNFIKKNTITCSLS